MSLRCLFNGFQLYNPWLELQDMPRIWTRLLWLVIGRWLKEPFHENKQKKKTDGLRKKKKTDGVWIFHRWFEIRQKSTNYVIEWLQIYSR